MDYRKSLSRAGFTLVEVLVAVLIIGILIGLLLPAVQAAFRRAKEAQVSAELNNIATALASFNNTYNDYPPSRIIIAERGYNFAGVLTNTNVAETLADTTHCTDITVQQLAQRSLLYLRKFWPRVDFLSDPGASAVTGHFHDFNGNGHVDSTYASTGASYTILSGSECLAFFLGGIPISTPTGYGVSGFSKSPTFPFVDPVTATNRSASNYEFNAGRLVDLDGDFSPSYLDPINTVPGSRRAYAYFSAYGTNSYDPNDVNGYDHKTTNAFDYEIDPNDPNAANVCEWGFTVGNTVTNGTTTSNVAVSPAPNPYTSGLTAPSTGNIAWINPKSFQIICCGQDGLFGYGGIYLQGTAGGTGPLPIESSGQIYTYTTPTTRLDENDNLTNFSTGRLN